MVWIVAAHVHWEMLKNHLLIKFRRCGRRLQQKLAAIRRDAGSRGGSRRLPVGPPGSGSSRR